MAYKDREDEIIQSGIGYFGQAFEIIQSRIGQLEMVYDKVPFKLSWAHYQTLMRIESPIRTNSWHCKNYVLTGIYYRDSYRYNFIMYVDAYQKKGNIYFYAYWQVKRSHSASGDIRSVWCVFYFNDRCLRDGQFYCNEKSKGYIK